MSEVNDCSTSTQNILWSIEPPISEDEVLGKAIRMFNKAYSNHMIFGTEETEANLRWAKNNVIEVSNKVHTDE